MVLVAALALVLAVFVIRELVRALAQGGPFRLRPFDLVTPGSFRRRVGVIGAGLFATYAAVVALGLGYAATYGVPKSTDLFAVGEVIAGGAAAGQLLPGDRIKAIDGRELWVGSGRTLVERINDKAGAPVELSIIRDDTLHTIRITPRQGTNASGQPQWMIGIRPALAYDRSTYGAAEFALAYPWHHARRLGRSITRLFEGRGDVAGVVRIVDSLRRANQPAGLLVLMAAQRWASHLLLLVVLLDLIRLVLAIRDRLRG